MKKNLMNLCFVNFKRSVPIQLSSVYQKDEEDSSPSLSHSSSGNSVVVTNFNSLYDLISDPDLAASTSKSKPQISDPDSPVVTPDFATVLASRRFFFSSPGRSNSIIDSSFSSSFSNYAVDPPESDSDVIVDGGVAIPTYSRDPYLDFRRSMEEMVESRCSLLFEVSSNWEWLHELLLCYLALNPKSMHKFIVGAFDDLMMEMNLRQAGRKASKEGKLM